MFFNFGNDASVVDSKSWWWKDLLCDSICSWRFCQDGHFSIRCGILGLILLQGSTEDSFTFSRNMLMVECFKLRKIWVKVFQSGKSEGEEDLNCIIKGKKIINWSGKDYRNLFQDSIFNRSFGDPRVIWSCWNFMGSFVLLRAWDSTVGLKFWRLNCILFKRFQSVPESVHSKYQFWTVPVETSNERPNKLGMSWIFAETF